ncbi:unnamed protein product [Dimorphilus gyrociliatus]|uniref:Uncharacterized protein n=1 Tax=Dimorphilus gyrociliatus TaxID=2664684 RepID=A0A7I8WEL1_9ANNE|nr:unnamed protein product [Dimorphilus gyrociliatus]
MEETLVHELKSEITRQQKEINSLIKDLEVAKKQVSNLDLITKEQKEEILELRRKPTADNGISIWKIQGPGTMIFKPDMKINLTTQDTNNNREEITSMEDSDSEEELIPIKDQQMLQMKKRPLEYDLSEGDEVQSPKKIRKE